MSVPECRNCKWLQRRSFGSIGLLECQFPYAQAKVIPYAQNARRLESFCGSDGKFFEPKPPTFVNHFTAFVASLLVRPKTKEPKVDFANYVPEQWKQ